VGDDGHGHDLLRALSRQEIATDLVVHEPSIPTFTYTKLINVQTGIEDLPRCDFIFNDDIPSGADHAISWRLRDLANHFDLICVSDQAETSRGGLVTESVRNELAELGKKGALIWVDSRRRIELFRHGVLKVNEEEAAAALLRTGLPHVGSLRSETQAPAVFVTKGGQGIAITQASGEASVPTRQIENPVDICGAGDSFTAGAAAALAVGASYEEAATLGHLVASITIMKKGTGSASPEELLRAEQALSI
jgi:sugar/nucleoside kinase (ribokinase family)